MRIEGNLGRSTKAKQETFQTLQKQIDDIEAKIENTQKFFENSSNILGLVHAGSGLRAKIIHTLEGDIYPTSLDWALIRVDDKCHSVTNEVRPLPASGH